MPPPPPQAQHRRDLEAELRELSTQVGGAWGGGAGPAAVSHGTAPPLAGGEGHEAVNHPGGRDLGCPSCWWAGLGLSITLVGGF